MAHGSDLNSTRLPSVPVFTIPITIEVGLTLWKPSKVPRFPVQASEARSGGIGVKRWYFSTDDTPWGTNFSYITLRDDLGWDEISVGGGTTGYPWSGVERHWRDGNIIRAQASVVGWRRYARGAERWVCPMYYKIGGWEGETVEVNCKTLRTWFPPTGTS